MATYKVLQDIEAEDTLVGPLTLRQCIYAAIAITAGYLSFMSVAKHAAYLVVFLLPFMVFGAFFAFPWSKQQSTEVWALAKVRFYFKPRVRIWDQSGAKELVTITAPAAVKKSYTSNLSPTEVTSRLTALADTIDSRGWAVKNIDLGYFTRGSMHDSDRLLDASNLPQDVPSYDASAIASADMFDMQNNPTAQKLDLMMSQSADAHREQIVRQMTNQANQQPPAGPVVQQTAQKPAQASDYWHMRSIEPLQPATPTPSNGIIQTPVPVGTDNVPYDISLPPPVYPTAPSQPMSSMSSIMQTPPSANPQAIDYANLRMPSAQPVSAPASTAAQTATTNPVTTPTNPAILELANNNDLNVATIAREARARNPEPPDEVVVSLR